MKLILLIIAMLAVSAYSEARCKTTAKKFEVASKFLSMKESMVILLASTFDTHD